MVDEIDDEDGGMPIRAKPTRVRLHSGKDGLTPEDERALQEVLEGFRAAWKLVTWTLKAITHGVIVAISGIIAVKLIGHFWPNHPPAP